MIEFSYPVTNITSSLFSLLALVILPLEDERTSGLNELDARTREVVRSVQIAYK